MSKQDSQDTDTGKQHRTDYNPLPSQLLIKLFVVATLLLLSISLEISLYSSHHVFKIYLLLSEINDYF